MSQMLLLNITFEVSQVSKARNMTTLFYSFVLISTFVIKT